jgi:phosphoglycerate dehydrogenase-like enzyme
VTSPDAAPLRIAVLDDYLGVALRLAPWDTIAGGAVTVFGGPIGGPEELVEALGPFDVVCAMRERTALPATVIERLPNLRLLVTTGMQNASIDVDAARARGIVVSGTGSVVEATVELTWALILAAARHVPLHDRSMRAGGWQEQLGTGLARRRLGVIGLGKNGTRVAAIGQAFGMDVVAWSQHLTEERAVAAGARLVGLDELLGTSDVITIHLRLSERTHHLLDRRALARLQPSTILVNTSRGPIVDESALVDALRERRIGGAALDVFNDEPLPADHPLRGLPNVVLSPHVGYSTDENLRRFYGETVEAIVAWQQGAPIRTL